jgi:cytochrome c-type biogenesis protein CcmH/NrfF
VTTRLRRWAPWVVLVVIVIAALVVGTGGGGHPSQAQQAASIASEVRCPACEGQSAELSDAPAAAAVRLFITQQVAAGQSKGQIERQLEDRYGSDILLRPPASGIDALVWVLPVVAIVVAVFALGLAFRRWRRTILGGGSLEGGSLEAGSLEAGSLEGGS